MGRPVKLWLTMTDAPSEPRAGSVLCQGFVSGGTERGWMRERLYEVCEETPGWSVRLRNRRLGLYELRDDALAAAARAARNSRARGVYAWVQVRPRDTVAAE